MRRRAFVQAAAAAAITLPWAAGRGAAALPREGGPNRFSVMLWTLANQASLDRSLEIVAAAGYSGVELTGQFQGWSEAETARVLSKMASLSLAVDSISGVQTGFADPGGTATFQAQLRQHLEFAQRLSCPQLILLSGKRARNSAPGAQRLVALSNLRWAGDLASKAGIEIVIEPIDLLENPEIYLASVTDAFDLADAVNQPGVKVLYDFYHEQRSFGNLTEKLERGIHHVGLVHVADVPGRHEPGTGEIAYATLYTTLAKLKYNRRIAMEYYPTGDPVASLRTSRESAEATLRQAGDGAR